MNKKLDLNSSYINYIGPESANDIYFKYHYEVFGKRNEFTKAFEQPYFNRFTLKSEEKNSDLLKKFVVEKNIDLNTQIKKLLE